MADWVIPSLCIVAAVHVFFAVLAGAARWAKRARPEPAETDAGGYVWSE